MALGLVGGGTIAFAGSTSSGPLSALTGFHQDGATKRPRPAAILRLVEKDIIAASGLTPAQIKAGRAAGQSLAQTVTANGGDPAAVEAKVMADFKSKLDAAVTSGTITAAQETTALTKGQAALDKFMNKVPTKPAPRLPAKLAAATLADAAKVIGITPAQLRTEMKTGQSIAQVANARGVSTDALVSGMTATVDSRIDAAVSSGKITADQATTLKAKVTDAVTKLVNRVPKAKPAAS